MRKEPVGDITEFYSGTTVFLTGATGSLGKTILEKLLRSCNLRTIYILVRIKKGKLPSERLEELFSSKVFTNVPAFNPTFKEQVRLITGALDEPDLGLSNSDKELLIKEVNIVIHCGATVRFDEKLKTAAYINVRATRDLLNIAQHMKNLKCFTYVSTAYSNCPKKTVYENIYEPPMTCDELLEMVEKTTENKLEEMTPRLIGDWPNTYVYSKGIAEHTVLSVGKGMPRVIVRPSVILPCVKEPLPGWIDNYYGMITFMMLVYAGISHVSYTDSDALLAVIPMDYVTNAVIASAWDGHVLMRNSKETVEKMPVYNCCTSNRNTITFRDFVDWSIRYIHAIPLAKQVWHTTIIFTCNKHLYTLLWFLFHTMPAHALDFVLKQLNRKPMLVKLERKFNFLSDLCSYFAINRFTFVDDNMHALVKRMTPKDRKIFYCDVAEIEWLSVLGIWTIGGKKYLANEETDMESLKRAAFKQDILKVLHYGLLALFFYGFLKLVGFSLRLAF